MAIYHFTSKIVSRGRGQSVVGSAAYQSGECLTNEFSGVEHDFTRKSGIVFSDIVLPPGAPDWMKNREKLWNSVEIFEKNKKSQLARQIEFALPIELDEKKRIDLAKKFVNHLAAQGMVCDMAIHDTGKGNPHCHVLLSLRPIENETWGIKSKKIYDLDPQGNRIRLPSGYWKSHKQRSTAWDKKDWLQGERKFWEETANKSLEAAGFENRIDRRSNKERGILKLPTKHLGSFVSAQAKKQKFTERFLENEKTNGTNLYFEKKQRAAAAAKKNYQKNHAAYVQSMRGAIAKEYGLKLASPADVEKVWRAAHKDIDLVKNPDRESVLASIMEFRRLSKPIQKAAIKMVGAAAAKKMNWIVFADQKISGKGLIPISPIKYPGIPITHSRLNAWAKGKELPVPAATAKFSRAPNLEKISGLLSAIANANCESAYAGSGALSGAATKIREADDQKKKFEEELAAALAGCDITNE